MVQKKKYPKLSASKLGPLNPMWGKYKEVVTIQTIHRRIEKEYPKPESCEFCGSTKKIELSNKDHKYSLNKSDYQWICKKCHFHFDKHEKYLDIGRLTPKVRTPEWKKKLGIAHIGKTPWNKGLKGAQVAWNKGTGKQSEICPLCSGKKMWKSKQCHNCRVTNGWLK